MEGSNLIVMGVIWAMEGSRLLVMEGSRLLVMEDGFGGMVMEGE